MCGRYRLARRKQIVEEHFDASLVPIFVQNLCLSELGKHPQGKVALESGIADVVEILPFL
jgi:putative SOS response-associated peptidase YedK